MRRVKIAPLMVVLSLLAAGCSGSPTGPLSADRFDLVFTLSEDEIGPDGFVTAELTVTSHYPDAVAMHDNGSRAEVRVLQGSQPVRFIPHGDNCPVPAHVEEFVLEPGKSHTLSWTMRSSLTEDFGEHAAGDPAPPGHYTVQLRAKLVAGDQELEVVSEAPLIVDEPATLDDLDLAISVVPDQVEQHEQLVVEISITNNRHRTVSLLSHSRPAFLPSVYKNDERVRLIGTDMGRLPADLRISLATGDDLTLDFTLQASMLPGTPGFEAGDPAPAGTYQVIPHNHLRKLDGFEVEFSALEATFTVTEAED